MVDNVKRQLTDVDAFIDELGAGVFKERLAIMLTETALGAVVNHKSGKLSVDFSIKPINEHGQVMIKVDTKFVQPTKTGHRAEVTTSDTVMWVGKGGVITLEQPREELSGQFSLVGINDGQR